MSTLAETLLRDLAERTDGKVPIQMYMTAVMAVLAYAGPPCRPIADYSEDFRSTIVRGKSGRAVLYAETWYTAPWRCVRLDIPSVPMGRPIAMLSKDTENARPVLHLDRASTTFQTRVSLAIAALGLRSPIGRCAVHVTASTAATFLAWRPLDAECDGEPVPVPGDVDNHAKNALDGLQKARVLADDKDVAVLRSSRATTDDFGPLPTLEARLLALLHERVSNESPVDDLEAAREAAGVTRKQMAQWFPAFPLKRGGKPASARTSAPRPHKAPPKTTPKTKAGTAAHKATKADTDAIAQQVRECFNAAADHDKTAAHVARTLGIHYKTAARHLKLMGLAKPADAPAQPQHGPYDDRIRESFDALPPDQQTNAVRLIADTLNMPRRTIGRRLRAMGLAAKRTYRPPLDDNTIDDAIRQTALDGNLDAPGIVPTVANALDINRRAVTKRLKALKAKATGATPDGP